jgi:predicted secreted protein
MTNLLRALRTCLMAGVSKLKKLPQALMEAPSVIANEGATSPVRVRARRKDRKHM